MKISHLTTVHVPDDVRIYHKQCRSLAEAGFSVQIVAAREGGDLDRVELVKVPPPRGRVERMTTSAWRVYRRAVELDSDLYHIHDPELIPLGLLLRLRGKKVVYDAHEDLPSAIMSKYYLPRRLRPLLARLGALLEWFPRRFFSGVVSATPAIARRFTGPRSALVQNFPLTSELDIASDVGLADRPPLVAYVGGISRLRGGREMVTAISPLHSSLGAELWLVGPVSDPKLESDLRALDGSSALHMPGLVSRDEVARILARARVGLVLFHPAPNHLDAQPNKLFEYMSAGLPVVASDFPLWREIVQEVGCGIVVNPLAPQEIAAAVSWLLSNPSEAARMGDRGRKAVRERYNWDREFAALLSFYQALATPARPPRVSGSRRRQA